MARQRKRKGDPVHGWLAFDKPAGMTSTRAVAVLKRLFNAQKAGHGGTLDPLADGILPVAFGEATKTSQYAMDAEKAYVFTIGWGESTASHDAEGEVVARSDARPDPAAISLALEAYQGTIDQVPPKYSAIKIDGERAYDLARDGEANAIDLAARPVRVFGAELLEAAPDAATIRVRTGKGFYVRAMARDLCAALGCEGHVTALRRLEVGAFNEANAASLEALEAMTLEERMAALEPIHSAVASLLQLDVGAAAAADIRLGRAVSVPRPGGSGSGGEAVAALAVSGKDAIALGELTGRRFQPKRVFQTQIFEFDAPGEVND